MMGTPALSAQRSSATINVKRQQFYLRPQYDPTRRFEVETMFPRGGDAIKFLRDLNAFSQEQAELENNEASASKDPRKKDYGSFTPLTQTAPIYAKPTGLASGSLPIEDKLLSMFFTEKAVRPVGTTTISSVTSDKEFVVASATGLAVGMPVYVGTSSSSVRHIAAISGNTITLNANLDSTPQNGDVVEAGPVVYTFNDSVRTPLANFLSQSDIAADLVTSMAVQSWNMEAGNDGYLQHSFEIGALGVFSGIQANFMGNRLNPIASDYASINTVFIAGGTIAADTAASAGDMTVGVDDGAAGDLTVAIPAGLIVKIAHAGGDRYYVTAAGSVSALNLAEPLALPVLDNAVITVYGIGNWKFTVAEADGVILATGTAGEYSVAVTDSALASLASAPAAGIPVYIDGNQYWTDANCTVDSLVLTTPLITSPASANAYFATKGTIGLLDCTRLNPYITVKNPTTSEIIMVGESGGFVEKSPGVYGYNNWDTTSAVNTIANVWRGMAGSGIKAILDHDDCDLYFPTPTGSDASPIQARKDVVTLIGDTKLTTKTVRIGVNKNIAFDAEERSLDDFAGLPEDDVREFTLEVEANYKPSFFAMQYASLAKAPTSLQTTVGAVKGRRVSVYVPKMTMAQPTRDAGDKKATSTIRANVYQDADVPAFYLAYC
ncbi:MAG: hypothetical protein HQM11_07650 [SAR324 cluster bacterium]|nr:hypothetical protein [SAR324 cluster bacterium]